MKETYRKLAEKAIEDIEAEMTRIGFTTVQGGMRMVASKKGFKIFGDNAVYWSNEGRPSEADLGKETKFPPTEVIADWMERKGIDLKYLYPICLKIKKFGTKGHHYLDKTVPIIIEELKENLGDRIKTRTYDRFKKISEKNTAS